MTISPKTVVSERTQIPPLAMVDYNGPDIDGQITRLAADGLSVEGWENVQLSRKDIEREWPRPPAAAPTDKSQQPQAAATPKTKRKKPPGPSPKTRLLVEAAMEAKYTLKQLTNMTEFELENEFKHLASRSTILRAKESLLSKRRRSKL
jgi:hypothetical protein